MKSSMEQMGIRDITGFFIPFILYTLYFILSASPAQAAIKQPPSNLGLVGYWSMDDCRGATSTDLSGQGNAGSLTNFALSGSTSNWVTGNSAKRGCALNFDGTNDYVRANDAGLPSTTSTRTVSVWYKLTTAPSVDSAMVTFGSAGTNTQATVLGMNNLGRLHISNWGSDVASPTASNDGVWHHGLATYNGSTYSLYQDGVLVTGPTAMTTNTVLNGSAYIGQSGEANHFYFPGSLDDVRIYNRALTAAEITTLYNAGATKLLGAGSDKSAGLVGHWKLDDGAGTSAVDSSGQRNTGTLTNFALATTTSNWGPGYRAGGLNFDGVNDYVATASTVSSFSSAQSHTYSAWVNPTSYPTSYSWIVNNGEATTGSSMILCASCGNKVRFFYAGGNSAVDGNAVIGTGVWTHVATVYDASTNKVTFYVNGVADATSVALSAWSSGSSVTRRLGSWLGSSHYFSGSMDDVRIYNRALSAEEVKTLYSSGTTRPTIVNTGSNKLTAGTNLASGLVGHWTFDGQYLNATTSTDTSGQGNNGTLSGGPRPALGKMGQALSFDGSDDYVDFGTSNSLNISGAGAISLWFKQVGAPGGSGSYHALVQRFDGSVKGYQLYLTSGNVFGFYSDVIINSNFTLGASDYTWHHYIATSDGTVTTFYVDGVSRGTGLAGFYNVTTPTWHAIGSYSSFGHANGSLDDVRVYNRALSATEVLQLYNLGR